MIPRFYAICSPPIKDTFEFIIKEAESNAFLTGAKVGEQVEMSLPQGKGYQIQEYFEKYKFDFPTTNVLILSPLALHVTQILYFQVILMACGTGLAPIASAIDSGLLGIGGTSYNSLFRREGR